MSQIQIPEAIARIEIEATSERIRVSLANGRQQLTPEPDVTSTIPAASVKAAIAMIKPPDAAVALMRSHPVPPANGEPQNNSDAPAASRNTNPVIIIAKETSMDAMAQLNRALSALVTIGLGRVCHWRKPPQASRRKQAPETRLSSHVPKRNTKPRVHRDRRSIFLYDTGKRKENRQSKGGKNSKIPLEFFFLVMQH